MSGIFGLSWRRKSSGPIATTATPPAQDTAAVGDTPPANDRSPPPAPSPSQDAIDLTDEVTLVAGSEASGLAERVLSVLPGAHLIMLPDGTIEHVLAGDAGQRLLGGDLHAGRLLHEVLGLPEEQGGMLQMWLASIVGIDEMGWQLHADEPPRLVDRLNGPSIEVDYAPMYEAGALDRIVVSVRPQTAPPMNNELSGVFALPLAPLVSEANSDNVDVFLCEARGLLAECDAAFERIKGDPAAKHAVNKLFRSLHTLKGNARTFGIGSVQEAAHSAEDFLDTVRASAAAVGAEALATIRHHLDTARDRVNELASRVQTTVSAITVATRDIIDDADALQRALDGVVRSAGATDDVIAGARAELQRCADRIGIVALSQATRAAVASPHEGPDAVRLDRMVGRLWTLLEELRRAALPQHFIAEFGRALDELRPLHDAGTDADARKVMVAVVVIESNADACGVSTIADAAADYAARLKTGSNGGALSCAAAFAELDELLAAARALAPLLPVRQHVDVLGPFQDEARRLLSAMERDFAAWSSRPREREPLESVYQSARIYLSAARRNGFIGLVEHAVELLKLLSEARKLERVQRSLMARIEASLAELDAHLALYQSFQVELRASGPGSRDLADAVGAIGNRRARSDAATLMTELKALGERAGLLCLVNIGDDAVAQARTLRLCIDARAFSVEPTAPQTLTRSAQLPAGKVVALHAAMGELRAMLAATATGAQVTPAVDALQRAIDLLTGVPLSEVADRLGREANDLGRTLSKDLAFEADVGELAFPEPVQRKLGEVLMHAMRNAVDHGIEPPEERLQKGKPRAGTVRLVAREEGDVVIIELIDDGKGVDVARVKQKALDRGFVTAAELGAMSDDEARQLIFRAGLSTSDRVTMVSGRGVGMDVVSAVAEELGGTAAITAEPAGGTRLTLRLPRAGWTSAAAAQ